MRKHVVEQDTRNALHERVQLSRYFRSSITCFFPLPQSSAAMRIDELTRFPEALKDRISPRSMKSSVAQGHESAKFTPSGSRIALCAGACLNNRRSSDCCGIVPILSERDWPGLSEAYPRFCQANRYLRACSEMCKLLRTCFGMCKLLQMQSQRLRRS